MKFEMALIRLSWILPASHREFMEVQNGSFGWLHRMLSPHPQPSRSCENQNHRSDKPDLRTTPLARSFLT